ncbi:MAG: hypothetical protein M3391_04360 [Actinomycetota bacterium]|nr:hypothetical protein [Actinomycetota bacterium]
MTLALSLASPFYCLQVSDRLVTSNRVAFDAQANKTLLCRFTNAVAALAYSGPAFLEGVPTDQWIARRLRGEPPQMGRGLYIGKPKWFTDIGKALNDLAVGLKHAMAPLRGGYSGYISVAAVGWQWRTRRRQLQRIRPVLYRLERPGFDAEFVVSTLPRGWDHGSSVGRAKFALCQTPWPNELTPEDVEALRGSLREGPADMGFREEELLKAIAKVAARDRPVVGQDCMSIRIPPVGSPTITIAYRGLAPERVFDERSGDPIRGSWTPWVVGGAFSLPPSFAVGPRIGVNNFLPYQQVEFDVSDNEVDPGFGFFGTQQRSRPL